MTDLERKVTRRAKSAYGRPGKRLVVGLFPGDLIGLREERGRTWFYLPLGTVYTLAVRAEVDRKRAERKKPRKGGRHA